MVCPVEMPRGVISYILLSPVLACQLVFESKAGFDSV